jgi:ribosomal protein S30
VTAEQTPGEEPDTLRRAQPNPRKQTGKLRPQDREPLPEKSKTVKDYELKVMFVWSKHSKPQNKHPQKPIEHDEAEHGYEQAFFDREGLYF